VDLVVDAFGRGALTLVPRWDPGRRASTDWKGVTFGQALRTAVAA